MLNPVVTDSDRDYYTLYPKNLHDFTVEAQSK